MVTQEHSACGISDVGRVRKNNEDVWANLADIHCYILADGMGGHQAGEIAAKEAVDTLCRHLKKQLKTGSKSLEETKALIASAFQAVNSHVYKLGKSAHELKGMGTTLCLLHLHPEGAILAHAGDSRIYRLRDKKLQLMTEDHSLLSELSSRGKLTQEEASTFHYKNIITKAVGTEPQLEPTIISEPYKTKDLFLLCSDGLSDLLTIKEMEEVLLKAHSLSEAASQLVSLSKMKGGHDNITVLIVQ